MRITDRKRQSSSNSISSLKIQIYKLFTAIKLNMLNNGRAQLEILLTSRQPFKVKGFQGILILKLKTVCKEKSAMNDSLSDLLTFSYPKTYAPSSSLTQDRSL